jgi:hypothetical protein
VLRQAVESFAGNPSWNTGVDYARLFEAVGAPVRDVVRALYAQAGLYLAGDLARLNAAPRITADPAGVDYARESSFDGRLAKPLLYMTTTGDPLSPVSNSRPLETAALAAGVGDLVRPRGPNGASARSSALGASWAIVGRCPCCARSTWASGGSNRCSARRAPSDTLAAQPRKLQADGASSRQQYCEHPSHQKYVLSREGAGALRTWGEAGRPSRPRNAYAPAANLTIGDSR